MGRKNMLSNVEQAHILAYRDCGISVKEVIDKTKRGKSLIYEFFKLGDKYGTKKPTGHRTTLLPSDLRSIKRLSRNTSMSPAQIWSQLELPVTTRRIQQVLHDDANL